MLKKPMLVILCGLPYAGKSTFSNLLIDKGYMHVWATKIKKDNGMKDAEMFVYTKKLIADLLLKGNNVIFDFINHTEEIRGEYVNIAYDAGADAKICYFDTPYDVILERMENTLANPVEIVGRSKISKPIIDAIQMDFEVPTGENVVRITPETMMGTDFMALFL